MNVKELIKEYLNSGGTRMMQIATSVDNQPWCVTVYYAVDEDLNLVWLSLPGRRHSKEIAHNPKIAGTIAYDQQPPTDFVRGVHFEGSARLLTGEEEVPATQIYAKQLKREDTLLDDIRSGKNPHKFYKVTIEKFVLFDSKNFPDNPRQEYHPAKA